MNEIKKNGGRHSDTPSSRKFFAGLNDICSKIHGVNRTVLRAVIEIAIEIAREGREGRKIGTMFVIGDEEKVLAASRNLILDPLQGHSPQEKHINESNMRETIKELAQLDGAFVVSNHGVFISAARYINADSGNIDLPLGLGSRHIAAASITRETAAVAIVVSESSVVRIFDNGKIIGEIIPEQWIIQRLNSGRYGKHGAYLSYRKKNPKTE